MPSRALPLWAGAVFIILGGYALSADTTVAQPPEPASNSAVLVDSVWERTADGWRRGRSGAARPRFDLIGVHPVVIAAGQLVASLAALLGLPTRLVSAGIAAQNRIG